MSYETVDHFLDIHRAPFSPLYILWYYSWVLLLHNNFKPMVRSLTLGQLRSLQVSVGLGPCFQPIDSPLVCQSIPCYVFSFASITYVSNK